MSRRNALSAAAARRGPLAGLTPVAPRRREKETGTRALLALALEAFREGRHAPWTSPAPNATQALYETQILSRLASADISALAMLAGPRESALALARAGKPDDARASITLARFIISLARLSSEGREYARTLHSAADSYLSFRRGDHEQAHAKMVAAIEATGRLASRWGECEFIVCRRVHLEHNLMRVEAAAGVSRQAMQRGARLLEYIGACHARKSAVESGAQAGAQLDARVAELFFDLVAETLAELLVTLPAPEARALLSSLSPMCALDADPTWRGCEWLAIKSASLGPQAREFLFGAAPFLRAGRGTTPTLWYAVAHDLLKLYGALGPVAAEEGIEEIAAELATGPRVPACMRDAKVPTRR